MSRYIDADKVVDLIKNYGKDAIEKGKNTLCPVDDIVALVQAVENLPASDLQEVKHGEWIEERRVIPLSNTVKTFYRCSACETHWDNKTRFCHNCGAAMEDKEGKDGDS